MVYSRVRVSGEIEAQVVITNECEISRISCEDYGLPYLEIEFTPIEAYTSAFGRYEICSEVEFDIMWRLVEKFEASRKN
jgi:hypothetical protein